MAAMTLVATGDAIAARRFVPYRDAAYRDLAQLVGDADVAFTNLEIVLNDFVGPASDWFNLSAEPAIAHDLSEFGFDVVSFANNHAMNYGEPGLLLTLDALAEAGLPRAGAGRNLREARRPVYVETPAGRVALLAATSTFSPGHQATHQRSDQSGRAGVNPLRFQSTHVVDQRAIDELRRVAERIGPHHPHRALVTRGGAPAPDDESAVHFLGTRFQAGSEPFRTTSKPDDEDVAELLGSVREARTVADLVLVSIHCHEFGGDRSTPPEFLETFARRCVDEGADAILGHGPHRLRALEIYRGKPIFYSLANFVYQPEYVMSLPGENYTTAEMRRNWSPHEFHAQFARDAEEWYTIVPRCVFDAHRVVAIELHPVTLAGDMPGRGTPRMASGDEAARILRRLIELSGDSGTQIDVRNNVGHVQISQ